MAGGCVRGGPMLDVAGGPMLVYESPGVTDGSAINGVCWACIEGCTEDIRLL